MGYSFKLVFPPTWTKSPLSDAFRLPPMQKRDAKTAVQGVQKKNVQDLTGNPSQVLFYCLLSALYAHQKRDLFFGVRPL